MLHNRIFCVIEIFHYNLLDDTYLSSVDTVSLKYVFENSFIVEWFLVNIHVYKWLLFAILHRHRTYCTDTEQHRWSAHFLSPPLLYLYCLVTSYSFLNPKVSFFENLPFLFFLLSLWSHIQCSMTPSLYSEHVFPWHLQHCDKGPIHWTENSSFWTVFIFLSIKHTV